MTIIVLAVQVTAAIQWSKASSVTATKVEAVRLAGGGTRLFLARLEEADAIILR